MTTFFLYSERSGGNAVVVEYSGCGADVNTARAMPMLASEAYDELPMAVLRRTINVTGRVSFLRLHSGGIVVASQPALFWANSLDKRAASGKFSIQ
jgi:hypothetical protein